MDWSTFNWLDYIILGVLAFSTAVSILRGFMREAISLAMWIAAIWAGFHYSMLLGERYLSMVEPAGARMPLAFIAILIVVLIVGSIINYAVGRLVAGGVLSFLDRLLGMVFGFARGVLLVAVMLIAMQVSAVSKTWTENSQLAGHFQSLSVWLKGFVPERIDEVKSDIDSKTISSTSRDSTADQAVPLLDNTPPVADANTATDNDVVATGTSEAPKQ